jgi:hypothetical protein
VGYGPPVHTKDLVAIVAEPINRIGPSFYFTPETRAVGKELGVDALRFYFLGRGGVLGDVDWAIVMSAFGYFNPTLLEKMWNTGRERLPARDAARAYLGCCHDFGRAHFAAVDGLDEFCAAAWAVNDAARTDPSGLTLWAGLAAQPLADDTPARAMQLVATLRELRGSAHLLAVIASGVPRPVAHVLRRPNDVAAFGWAEGQIPAPTDADRRGLAAADALTNQLMVPAFSVLDDAGVFALRHGLDGMEAALAPR